MRAVPRGDPLASGEVELKLANEVSDDEALAFHTRTLLIAGGPCGLVELPQCAKYGLPWTAPACHELAEIFGNPLLQLYVKVANGRTYPREIC